MKIWKNFVFSWVVAAIALCFISDGLKSTDKVLADRHCKLQANYFGTVARYACDNGVTEYHVQ